MLRPETEKAGLPTKSLMSDLATAEYSVRIHTIHWTVNSDQASLHLQISRRGVDPLALVYHGPG